MSGEEPEHVRPPRAVLSAVRLMYAGAALEVLAIIVAVLTIGSLRSAIFRAHPDYTTAQLHTAEAARTLPLIVGAAITIGLWLWMAWANRSGRSWARAISAGFFGINTVDLLISFSLAHGTATLIMALLIWLVGLAAIALIFSKGSGPFYQHQPT
ncbi:MAG TPA: hypothetical protein VK802_10045 [Streptosporangiaceae bacterium]|jgi:hypothetical protein|nr:hypothetical protein [Streptosporangiaceae bacterium]